MGIAQRAAATVVSLAKLVGRYLLLLFALWGIGAAVVTGEALWVVAALPLAAYVGLIAYRSYRGVDTPAEPAVE